MNFRRTKLWGKFLLGKKLDNSIMNSYTENEEILSAVHPLDRKYFSCYWLHDLTIENHEKTIEFYDNKDA